jgi:peptide/nickel transport system ATP-binding protein
MNRQPLPAEGQVRPLLEACGLTKVYKRGQWPSSRIRTFALQDVNLAIFPGSALALVGKSGSGKSTLGRCLAWLEKPDAGEIRFRNVAATTLSRSELQRIRPCVQLVWQHSALALNPRFRAVDIVAEPLLIQRAGSKSERREQALAMMSKLGLPTSIALRKPLELSGGQRQRLAIARALMRNPAVIILDEALAGLDLPLQTQITNLLLELKASLSLTYLFISHDLRRAASLAERIAVMQNGRIVENQPVRDLFLRPQHEATRDLLNSIPTGPPQ